MVRWAVSKGFGHKQLAQLLKPIFLREAQKLLEQQSRPSTDSALALVSGLHRGDVQKWRTNDLSDDTDWSEISEEIPLTDQILANWMLAKLPASIPYKTDTSDRLQPISFGPQNSFCDLIRLTPKVASHGFSAHLILQDMIHRGLVTELNGTVTLCPISGKEPSAESVDHAMHHLCAVQKDLLATGHHNIHSLNENRLLEQSLEVDELSPQSVEIFYEEVQKQWRSALAQLLPLARQLSDKDEAQGGRQRLRLSIYFYKEEEPVTSDQTTLASATKDAMDARVREHDIPPNATVSEVDEMPDACIREPDGSIEGRISELDTEQNTMSDFIGHPSGCGPRPPTGTCPETGQSHIRPGTAPPKTG